MSFYIQDHNDLSCNPTADLDKLIANRILIHYIICMVKMGSLKTKLCCVQVCMWNIKWPAFDLKQNSKPVRKTRTDITQRQLDTCY